MLSEQSGSNQSQATKGRCMCGDLRYEFTGPVLETPHCHCESCRRHSSSPFSTFIVIDKKSFRYTRGEPVLYRSSPGVERTHCGRCGAPISYENAQEFALYACTLENLAAVKPDRHLMVGEMLPWLEFADDLPCYEKGSHGKTPICYGPRNRKAGGSP